MTQVMVNMSMSLDGFAAGPEVGVDFPMGKGGERLHDWLFKRGSAHLGDAASPTARDVDAEVTQEVLATTGAVILGKRTFDVGLPHWGGTPYPVPCFVLTHTPHPVLAQPNGSFTFVTDGIESALRQAEAVAQGKTITLMGIDVAQQFLKAGLVDGIQLNLVPVLLGAGVRLFDQLGTPPIELQSTRVLDSTAVTHLNYRVIK